MTTSETVTAFQRLNNEITLAEGLALAEKIRIEKLTVEELLNTWTPALQMSKSIFLQAVASNHIDLNHIEFTTQATIHGNDCLVCGAVRLGA